MPTAIDYRQQITKELAWVPEEKLADLAKIVHVLTEDSPKARLERCVRTNQPKNKALGWNNFSTSRINFLSTKNKITWSFALIIVSL